MNVWREYAARVRQDTAPDDLVKCAKCARYRMVGHKSQAARRQWSMVNRQDYVKRMGCGLTGEALSPSRARRCVFFIHRGC